MTYAELLKVLTTMKKVSPEKLQDDVRFIDINGRDRKVSHTEYNDGSLCNEAGEVKTFQLLLMEV